MEEPNEQLTAEMVKSLRVENAALLQAVEPLKRENQELGKKRCLLRLEADVLEKVDEILKKRRAPISIT